MPSTARSKSIPSNRQSSALPQAGVLPEPAQRALLIPPPHVQKLLRRILIHHLSTQRVN